MYCLHVVRKELQWGLGFLPEEIIFGCLVPGGLSLASMGPRVFTRGNAELTPQCLSSLGASMGPRVFTRGNADNFEC